MKKIFVVLLAGLCCETLFSALPGDLPGEAKTALEWVDCSPMPLGKADDNNADIPDLRVLVFMLTTARDSRNTMNMLDDLRKNYYGKVLFAAITPDTVTEAESFRELFPNNRVRFAVDVERKITPDFMRETIMLFPMAFLLDRDGMVIWRGEAVDLADALEKHFAGKLPLDVQKEIAPLMYRMQQAIRDGNMFSAVAEAQKILDIDPGNPAALRMAVFAAESVGKVEKAWQIVSEQLEKDSSAVRLHFTALDMTMRHASLRKYLQDVINDFAKQDLPVSVRCAFIDSLLNNFPFDPVALTGARDILASTPMPLNSSAAQLAMLLAVRGKLNYFLGNLNDAESDYAEAAEYFRAADDPRAYELAVKQRDYMRAVIKLRQENTR